VGIIDRALGTARRLLGAEVKPGAVALTLVAAWWMTVLSMVSTLAAREATSVYFGDFGRFYYSATQALHGQPMYRPVPPSYRASGYELRQRTDLNPPHAHLIFLPLAKLPIRAAWWIWQVAGLLAIGWTCRVVARELDLRLSVPYAGAVTLALGTNMGMASWWVNGQVTAALSLPLTLAWISARRGRWIASGAWLGRARSVKPILGLLAQYLFWRREWRAVAVAAGMSALAFGSGLVAFGVDSHFDWIADLGRVTWFAENTNASYWGAVARIASPPDGILIVLGCALIAGSAALAIQSRRTDVDAHWVIVLVAALLMSPLGWLYYTPWLLPPLTAMVHDGSPATRVKVMTAAAPLWIPWSFVSGTVYTAALCALAGAVVFGSEPCIDLYGDRTEADAR
jgi:hypothetical protein